MFNSLYDICCIKRKKNHTNNICKICNNKLNINDYQYFIKVTGTCLHKNKILCYGCVKDIINKKNIKFLKKYKILKKVKV